MVDGRVDPTLPARLASRLQFPTNVGGWNYWFLVLCVVANQVLRMDFIQKVISRHDLSDWLRMTWVIDSSHDVHVKAWIIKRANIWNKPNKHCVLCDIRPLLLVCLGNWSCKEISDQVESKSICYTNGTRQSKRFLRKNTVPAGTVPQMGHCSTPLWHHWSWHDGAERWPISCRTPAAKWAFAIEVSVEIASICVYLWPVFTF